MTQSITQAIDATTSTGVHQSDTFRNECTQIGQ